MRLLWGLCQQIPSREVLFFMLLAFFFLYEHSHRFQQCVHHFISLHVPEIVTSNTYIQTQAFILRFIFYLFIDILTLSIIRSIKNLIFELLLEIISLRQNITSLHLSPDQKEELYFLRDLCRELQSDIKVARMKEQSLIDLLERKDSTLEERHKLPSVNYAMHIEKVTALRKKYEEEINELLKQRDELLCRLGVDSENIETLSIPVQLSSRTLTLPIPPTPVTPKKFFRSTFNDLEMSPIKTKVWQLEEDIRRLEMEKKILEKERAEFTDTIHELKAMLNTLQWQLEMKDLELTKDTCTKRWNSPKKPLTATKEESVRNENTPVNASTPSKTDVTSPLKPKTLSPPKLKIPQETVKSKDSAPRHLAKKGLNKDGKACEGVN